MADIARSNCVALDLVPNWGETKLGTTLLGSASGYGDGGWKIELAPERILESSGADAAGASVFAAWSGS